MKNAHRDQFFRQLDGAAELSGLFDLLPEVSFFVKDADGRFMALNTLACRYCGVASEADAIGKTDHDLFPKTRADDYRADDLAVMRSGQALYNRLESAPEDAGSPRLVITSKRPLRSRAGAVIGIAGCSRLVEDTQEQGRGANALAVVIDRLHKDFAEPLRAADLADLAGMSVARLERLFRRAFGASLRQYIIRVRVENAMRMLTDTDESVSATAQSCGFYDHAHFSRAFRRFTGETPSEFREKRSLAAASVPRST